MRAPELPFERYMSKQILFFAYLTDLSFSFRAQSAKSVSAICIFNISEKLQNIFEIGLKKYGVIVQKSLLEKNIFRNKKLLRHGLIFHKLN